MTATAAARAQEKISAGFVAFIFAASSLAAAMTPFILSQAVSAAGTAVRPSALSGWSTSGTGGSFSTEQAKVGNGSYRFATGTTGGQKHLMYKGHSGTKLSDITSLSYSSFVEARATDTSVAPLVRIDTQLPGTNFFGQPANVTTTLIWEPANAGGTTTGVWQDWDPLTQGRWWASPATTMFPNNNTYKTWSEISAAYPNATVRAGNGVYLSAGQNSAGAPWGNFIGYVDNFSFNGNAFDFEPNANPVVTGENFNTHSGSDYKGLNVGFNINDFGTVSAVTVDLYQGTTKLATNTHNAALLSLINSGTTQLSTPFIIQPGSYTETFWNLGTHNLGFDTKPTKAVVTVTGANGMRDTTVTPLTEPNGWAYESLVPLTAPTQLTPTDNASVNGASLTNSWTSVVGATQYQYQSFSDASMNNLRWDETFTSNSKTATNVANNTTFWWRVRALNNFGTESAWSPLWKVSVDNEVPTTPTGGAPHNVFKNTSSGWSFTWNASTDNSGAVTYEYQSTKNPAQTGGILTNDLWNNITQGDASQNNLTTPAIPTVGASDGKWYWQVRAIDAAGNKSGWSQIWNTTVDTVKPVINSVTPGANSSVKGNVTFKVDWSDDNKSYSYVELNKNGVWKTDGTKDTNPNADELTIDTTVYADGTYGIKVSVVDKAGNSTGQNFTFAIDNTRPSLTFVLPADNELKNGSFPVTINGTDNLNLKRLAVNIYNESNSGGLLKACGSTSGATPLSVTSGQLTCTFNPEGLADGIYTLRASATDLADNTFVETQKVRIDNNAPIITPNIADGSIINDTQTISMNVEEANPRAYNIRVYNEDGSVAQIDGVNIGADDRTPPIANPLGFNLDTTKLADGARYRIVFSAVDLFEQRDTKTAWFTVDRTAPTTSITPISGIYGGTNNTVNINFTVSDNNLASWTLSGPNGYSQTGTNVGTFDRTLDVSALGSGAYPITLTAIDKAGNTAPLATTQVSVDRDATIVPNVNTVLSKDDTIDATLNESGLVDFVIVDEDGDEVSITETPTANTAAGTVRLSFNTRQLKNGDYTVIFNGADTLGNVAAEVRAEFEVLNNPLLVVTPVLIPSNTNVLPATIVVTAAQPAGLVATQFNTTNPQTLGIASETSANDENGEVKSAATSSPKEKEVITQASSNSAWWFLLVIAVIGAVYYGYRNWKLSQANK